MARCDTLGCMRERQAGIKYCNIHNPASKANAKAAAAAKKTEDATARARQQAAEREARLAQEARLRAVQEEQARRHRVAIQNQASVNLAGILVHVGQVRALRTANPTRAGINAGSNAGLDPNTGLNSTVVGGTANPYTIVGTAQVSADEVMAHMLGRGQLDNSDSGLLKHRTSDGIFIHVST